MLLDQAIAMRARRHFLFFSAALAATAFPGRLRAKDEPFTVFAAASLKGVLADCGDAYVKAGGEKPVFSFAGSATLARQIELGAPAAIFASADTAWMDYLDERGLIVRASRRDRLGNALVAIVPADSPLTALTLDKAGFDAALGQDGRIATGDPASVPVGRYAKAALQALGLWEDMASRIAGSENVRIALQLTVRNEAALGIVYRTDALAEPGVKIVAEFPASSYPPIVYPFALIAGAGEAKAKPFLAFLEGPEARAIFDKAGFVVLER
jgi:molybdate transport system substrate-binding protein